MRETNSNGKHCCCPGRRLCRSFSKRKIPSSPLTPAASNHTRRRGAAATSKDKRRRLRRYDTLDYTPTHIRQYERTRTITARPRRRRPQNIHDPPTTLSLRQPPHTIFTSLCHHLDRVFPRTAHPPLGSNTRTHGHARPRTTRPSPTPIRSLCSEQRP